MASLGCIYVVGLMDGRVKVGATAQLRERLVTHRATLGKESQIIGEWASPLHRNYFANEKVLIGFLGGTGEVAIANYVDVVRFASGLDFDESESDSLLTESEKLYKKVEEQRLQRRAARHDRDAKIMQLRSTGVTVANIAEKFELTRQRVDQIIRNERARLARLEDA